MNYDTIPPLFKVRDINISTITFYIAKNKKACPKEHASYILLLFISKNKSYYCDRRDNADNVSEKTYFKSVTHFFNTNRSKIDR